LKPFNQVSAQFPVMFSSTKYAISSVGFTTLDSREAAWVNPATKSAHKIRTKEGVCVAPTLVGASLS